MNTPIQIEEFLERGASLPIIDVRSPAEFKQGHIPGAHNIPLFDNEERAKVGTAYKQIGREEAIRIGFELVSRKLTSLLSQVQAVMGDLKLKTENSKSTTSLIHCWRGGMRSANFAHLLNVYGYTTYTLVKGYKAYRNFVLRGFHNNASLFIVGGETGSGKTEILKKITEKEEQVIDLEALAQHKGSAFGSLGEKPQPTQEQFENELSDHMNCLDFSKKIWLEDESRNIGKCQVPLPFWEKMKQAPIFRLNIPKPLRIERLMVDYGNFPQEELKTCILKIEQRLGGQHMKYALEELEKRNFSEVAGTMLTYYDKAYHYNHEKRKMKDVFIIESETADAAINAEKIITFAKNKFQKEYA